VKGKVYPYVGEFVGEVADRLAENKTIGERENAPAGHVDGHVFAANFKDFGADGVDAHDFAFEVANADAIADFVDFGAGEVDPGNDAKQG